MQTPVLRKPDFCMCENKVADKFFFICKVWPFQVYKFDQLPSCFAVGPLLARPRNGTTCTAIFNAKHFIFFLCDYRKIPKFSDTRNLCCNLPKIQTKRPNHRDFFLLNRFKWNSKQ